MTEAYAQLWQRQPQPVVKNTICSVQFAKTQLHSTIPYTYTLSLSLTDGEAEPIDAESGAPALFKSLLLGALGARLRHLSSTPHSVTALVLYQNSSLCCLLFSLSCVFPLSPWRLREVKGSPLSPSPRRSALRGGITRDSLPWVVTVVEPGRCCKRELAEKG